MNGLTNQEAEARLKNEGFNEIPSAEARNILGIILDVIREPMLILLIISALLYVLIGDFQEGLILSVAVAAVISLTIYQEQKTENTLNALRNLSSPRAVVVRSGKELRIAGRELVRDDLIILREGDRIPADAFILENRNLLIDESVLTGESVPVRKGEWNGDENEKLKNPGGEKNSCVYSGTMVVGGWSTARVYATGMNSELGKIGKSIGEITEEDTLLSREIRKIVRIIAIAAITASVSILVIYGFVYQNWLKGILSGLTFALAILPEEFPVVLTVFFTLGAWRIAKNNVLTRKLSAIETLGAATVLCTDKTGTITMNRMKLVSIFVPDHFWSEKNNIFAEEYHSIIEYGMMAGQKDPFDPMERAIRNFAEEKLSGTEHIHDDWNIVREYPLTNEFLSMSEVWKSGHSDQYLIAAKGAPEVIFDLCHLTDSKIEKYKSAIQKMAEEGFRVLGVAKAVFENTDLPQKQHDFDFEFLGLIGFADPVRDSVKNSVEECFNAGIHVIMITGDYPATARNIGTQVGLKNTDQLITGEELDRITDEELKERISSVSIFCRVVPAQKLRIVNILKEKGEIVAMTGDGVNDAPALKASHIGISMGLKGTDVAREASSLVLLDDDFSSIVAAIRMGRRIYSNLQKAISYIISIHIPIAGLSFLPVISSGFPVIFWPIHIAFLELIIDPACSLAFEAQKEESDTMRKPPRTLDEPVFSKKNILISSMQGISVFATILVVYFTGIYLNYSESVIRTVSYSTLMFSNLGLILTNQTRDPYFRNKDRYKNKTLLAIVTGSAIVFAVTLFVPYFQKLFHFSPIDFFELLISFVAAIAGVFWFEIYKYRKWNGSKNH